MASARMGGGRASDAARMFSSLARAVRSTGVGRQVPAALASRSFHASSSALAPKEMTVRDALNSALVSMSSQ